VYGGGAVFERTSDNVGIFEQCEAARLRGRSSLFVEQLSSSRSEELAVWGGDGSEDEMEKFSDGGRRILLLDMARKYKVEMDTCNCLTP